MGAGAIPPEALGKEFFPYRPWHLFQQPPKATKARLLLMACLLRFGSLPSAADVNNATPGELETIRARLDEYQAVFDTH